MRRFLDGYFVGNYVCWGIDNKETPIRVMTPETDGVVEHIEIKSLDHTANMYYAFAAIIACGIEGVKKLLQLPPHVVGDPSNFDEDGKKKHEIKNLPITF